jgi:hypothetical protein
MPGMCVCVHACVRVQVLVRVHARGCVFMCICVQAHTRKNTYWVLIMCFR